MHDHNPGLAQPGDHRVLNIPEQAHHRHAQRNAQCHLLAQQLRVGGRGNQVHAEGPVRALAHALHFGTNQRQRLAHHAKKTEAAGLGHRSHQLGARNAPHAGQQHRMAATQQIAQSRARQ